jgi:TP901 family phage tail tape measure protein
MPNATTEIINLKQNIQGLSVQYGKDAIDLAKGAYQVVSAFGEQAASSKKLELSTIAATAGMSTTTDAINLLSAVSKGYNTTSDEQIEKISDLAFQTVKLGQTTFPELAASIGRVVPSAATLGVKVEELNAIFATLTGVTGNAAEVSTQTAGIMRALIKPTEGMQAAMGKLGFTTGEQMLKNMGLVQSLNALVGTTDGTTISIGKLFRRAEAMTALFALTGTQSDTFKFKLGEMGKAAGSSAKALGAVTDGVNKAGFTFEQTKQRVTVLVQTIGDAFLPVLNAMMSAMEPFINVMGFIAHSFASLPSEVRVVIGGLVALTATTLLATAAGLKFMVVWAKMPATFLKIASAVGPYVAALAGAVIAGKLLEAGFDAIGRAYDRAMAKIQENAKKEKSIQDRMIAFRKQANAQDVKLIQEAVKRSLELEGVSYESRLRFQEMFLQRRSENFRNFQKESLKQVKAKTTAEIQAELEAQKRILEITTAAREKATAGTIQEFQFRREQAAAAYRAEQDELKSLNASKAAFVASARGYNAELSQIEADRIEFIKQKEQEALEARKQENTAFYEYLRNERLMMDEFVKQQDMMAEFAVLEGRERERAALDMWHEEQRNKLIALLNFRMISLKQFSALRLVLEQQYYDKKKALENQDQIHWTQQLTNRLQKYMQYFSLVGNAFAGYLNAKQKKLDQWYENERKRIEQSTMTNEQREAALENLEETYTNKKRELVRKQAILDKAQNMAAAIMNVATGITKAYAAGPIIGLTLGSLIAALGAAQIAIIARTPLPMEVGGMTKSEGLAMLHPNEVVMPIEKVPELFTNQNITGPSMTFNVQLIDASDFEQITTDKIVPILERASMNEQFRIDQRAVVQDV